ncbi:MAG: type I methionyl aminopeptidase [Candidatus Yanofskybacteria bacterium RIFCSPHIGHO2_01_FULL_44_17]|uniref:Methionine aminopeptidase n=1 Tax=Candidatus Yanofskybacteria bacterium RIFCSPHIGHO2_01_FULL_44_17 TaxID=1802668 RepID=A0A1F8ESP0_9BACT|nr:MAG: type I methionyl aminopeptidase [Candidatus Yanofskybacteria bacterium RIFCSPHIGHO2_01_FULL_44_17]
MIHLKTPQEIKTMAEGGKILAEIIKKLSEAVKPGITTQELNKLAGELILFYSEKEGGKVKTAFLGYGDYPAHVCTSVNDEVVHCVPSGRELKEGDLISLDMGIRYKDFYLDSAVTVPVLGESSYDMWSKLNPKLHRLLEVTKESLGAGIKQAKIGNRIGDISCAVQSVVENNRFGVIRELVGHGIGRNLHEEPQVPNFGVVGEGVKLEEGMVIAIEPMVALGDWRLAKGADGFTYKTKDGSYAAHFEHTVAVTKAGPLILTKP